MHSTTKRTGHTLTLLNAPAFDDDHRVPPKDATIWRITLSSSLAFKLICDIGHLYPTWERRPRVGAMLELDVQWTLYIWPKHDPDSQLLLLMLGYGAARLCDTSHWHGQAWVTGEILAKTLAKLACDAYWNMTVADPKLTKDEQLDYLLTLPNQVAS